MGSKGTYDRYAVRRIPVRNEVTLNCAEFESFDLVNICLDAYLLEGAAPIPDKLLLSDRLFIALKRARERKGLLPEVRFRGILCEAAYA